MLYTFTLIILQRERLNIYLFCSLERRWSRRTFSYTCLVTTSPSLLNTPSIQPSLRLGFVSSGTSNSGGVTGGVYKAREHIQRSVADLRLLATPSSRGWVSTLDLYWGWFLGICSRLLYCFPLYQPLSHVCSPGHKGRDDLTSSSPSSTLSVAVLL